MTNKTYDLGWHLVAFLDVLGQREQFRQLKLPTTPQEELATTEVIKRTAGFVDDLRDQFREEFEEFEHDLCKSHARVESLQPKFLGFSDSFFVSVGLWNAKDDYTFFAKIYSTFAAATSVMMTSLGRKHALRGGIDIGLGCEIANGEVYGTALERAYLLECRNAEYPRILIGDELWKYLSEGLEEFERQKTPAADKICKVIRKTMQFTGADSDGRRILDYMGNFVKTIAKAGAAETSIRPAHKFVVAEHEHWILKGNAKLSGRYALLRRYFESRLALWEMESS
jgi:hypothetical protein